ncbi:hypothetical protein V501_07855 [Pseudogymnoascus sp. VKM F-4519 (FW-2642)]|nr:hypothetical protein V501_07855 [Pseudogymnoascus sp. VKM F-4519 (FW-2642)]
MFPFITLEEHYVSVKARETDTVDDYASFPQHMVTKLRSLGDERIQDLDKGNVSLQVISHSPGTRSPAVCLAANDELAAAISKNPTRMAGFATLPMKEPEEAAKELERCVRDLAFVGALVDNHADGKFYDDERFWTVFEKANELDVPIYIHPTYAADSMMEHYKGNYDDAIAVALSAYGWGWHADTGLHILKLFASGLFDRFPEVKIVVGHMGELLPFQLERVIAIADRFGKKRGFREVWNKNIWITTSGMFALAPLACLLQTTSIDRVLYSVDYPFSSNEKGLDFFKEIEKSGLIAGEDLEKFAYRNAQSLLRVKAQALLAPWPDTTLSHIQVSPATDETKMMADQTWDVHTASEDMLTELCHQTEKLNGIIGGYKEAIRVIKLSNGIAVKIGRGVTAAEARTQEFAHQNVDPSIVHVPQVYRFFERDYDPRWSSSKGYLFMDPWDALYQKPLIEATNTLLSLTDEERRLARLVQIARSVSLRYSFDIDKRSFGLPEGFSSLPPLPPLGQ